MIIRHPCHPNHLTQDLNSISRTFLEQFALVSRSGRGCILDSVFIFCITGCRLNTSKPSLTSNLCYTHSFTVYLKTYASDWKAQGIQSPSEIRVNRRWRRDRRFVVRNRNVSSGPGNPRHPASLVLRASWCAHGQIKRINKELLLACVSVSLNNLLKTYSCFDSSISLEQYSQVSNSWVLG